MHWFREAWLLFPPDSQDGIFGLKSCQYEIGTFLGYTQVPIIWGMGLGSGPQKLHLSCSTAARWGLSPSCWVQGPNPAQSWGVKRFSKFLAPFDCTFSKESAVKRSRKPGGGMKTSSVHLCLWSWTEAFLRCLKLWFWIKGCVITWEMCEKISC